MAEPALHHVGYVVSSIALSIDGWRSAVSPVSVSPAFEDIIQGARVIFLDLPAPAIKLELIEPFGAPVACRGVREKGRWLASSVL